MCLIRERRLCTLACLRRAVADVAHSSAAEVCWYLPQTREQFRMSGLLTIVDEAGQGSAMQEVSAVQRLMHGTGMHADELSVAGPPCTCWAYMATAPLPPITPASLASAHLSRSHAMMAPGRGLRCTHACMQARQAAWTKLSDPARVQFAWPHPGQPRELTGEQYEQIAAPGPNVREARMTHGSAHPAGPSNGMARPCHAGPRHKLWQRRLISSCARILPPSCCCLQQLLACGPAGAADGALLPGRAGCAARGLRAGTCHPSCCPAWISSVHATMRAAHSTRGAGEERHAGLLAVGTQRMRQAGPTTLPHVEL